MVHWIVSDSLHIKDISWLLSLKMLILDSSHIYVFFCQGVTCLDLITQSNPPVSINECVLCLHLPQKTKTNAGTRWWNVFDHRQQQQTPENSVFVLFFIYKLKLQKRIYWSDVEVLQDMKSFLRCWMQFARTTLGMRLISDWGTEDNKPDIYWQLSYDFNPMWHILEVRFLET